MTCVGPTAPLLSGGGGGEPAASESLVASQLVDRVNPANALLAVSGAPAFPDSQPDEAAICGLSRFDLLNRPVWSHSRGLTANSASCATERVMSSETVSVMPGAPVQGTPVK